MISPTGWYEIRNDRWGDGTFGSKRDEGKRKHDGVDYLCEPGQDIYSPINGFVRKIVKRFSNDIYSGIVIENKNALVQIFYLIPVRHIVGKDVIKGEKIGVAQDISKRYKGMLPHVHIEMVVNPEVFMNMP